MNESRRPILCRMVNVHVIALCILIKSPRDWERPASRTAKVYAEEVAAPRSAKIWSSCATAHCLTLTFTYTYNFHLYLDETLLLLRLQTIPCSSQHRAFFPY